MEFDFEKESYQSFKKWYKSTDNLSFNVVSPELFGESKNCVEITNALYDFIDQKIRKVGQTIRLYVEEHDVLFKIIDQMGEMTKFHNCFDPLHGMIWISLYDNKLEVNVSNLFIWDGIDEYIHSEIERQTLRGKYDTFLVVNTFTEKVYEKRFFIDFFELYEFDILSFQQ